MATEPDLIVVGAIAGAFGVRGEVRLKSFTAAPEAIFDYGPLLGEDGRVVLSVERWRAIQDGFAAVAREVGSREQAEALKSTRLCVARHAFPDPGDDEFYHADLIGLTVKALDGAPLGVVRAVHNFGASDLLEIWRTPGRSETWLLPFTKACAPHVDLAAGELIADPPEAADEDPADGRTPTDEDAG